MMPDEPNARVQEIRRLLAGADVLEGWEAECEQEGIPGGRPAVWNVVWRGHGMSIVEFVNGDGEANAHLIAAAPTLLAWAADEIERLLEQVRVRTNIGRCRACNNANVERLPNMLPDGSTRWWCIPCTEKGIVLPDYVSPAAEAIP